MQHPVKLLLQFHEKAVNRFVWPCSHSSDNLVYWRANILASLLIAGLVFGSVALLAAFWLILKERAWALAAIDPAGFNTQRYTIRAKLRRIFEPLFRPVVFPFLSRTIVSCLNVKE